MYKLIKLTKYKPNTNINMINYCFKQIPKHKKLKEKNTIKLLKKDVGLYNFINSL